ncbi:required for excision 1-B domain-containing protein-like [Asterias rubens]|uniref:required for excision 1-B domain-containing protein-like n=1 Tax=Asterias rubens TaxID=7604 RepID=UPI0014558F68|nr:required for excision 1-B domain-containing protein-like [Asterias rubens]
MVEEDPSKAIKEFFSLQEERIKCYKRLDQHHLEYLDTSPDYDFPVYRQAVHECTQEFSRISQCIIAVEERFQGEFQNAEIARLIGKVQENEKRKLELTGMMQLIKQKHQEEPNPESEEDLTQLKLRINATVSQIAELLQDLRYEAEDLLT